MDEPTKRREYLRAEFQRRGVELKEASGIIGRNPTYIQQYIGTENKPPKPRYLHEQDRKALVRAYPFLDEERLKPPEKVLPVRQNGLAVLGEGGQAQLHSYPIKDGERRQLLEIWGRLDYDYRVAATLLLSAAARGSAHKIGEANNLSHQADPPEPTTGPGARRK